MKKINLYFIFSSLFFLLLVFSQVLRTSFFLLTLKSSIFIFFVSFVLKKVNANAIKSMKEIGYDLNTHFSKALSQIPDIEYDYAITMGCGDECPLVKAKNRTDWDLPDPKNMNEHDFNEVRDTIENKVIALIDEIKHNS